MLNCAISKEHPFSIKTFIINSISEFHLILENIEGTLNQSFNQIQFFFIYTSRHIKRQPIQNKKETIHNKKDGTKNIY